METLWSIEDVVCERILLPFLQAALRERPPVVMIVGNKSDRVKERVVSIEEGRRLALVGTAVPHRSYQLHNFLHSITHYNSFTPFF